MKYRNLVRDMDELSLEYKIFKDREFCDFFCDDKFENTSNTAEKVRFRLSYHFEVCTFEHITKLRLENAAFFAITSLTIKAS